jgi:hypothetical protein
MPTTAEGPQRQTGFWTVYRSHFAHLAEGTLVGQRLPELERLGLDDGRVLRDGDLRLVYRLRESDAVVALIARDGRSMQSLLQRRTLDS